MIPANLNGAAPVSAPQQQEIPPAPPEAADVQEFQKLYWGENPGKPGVDPMLNLNIPVEIDPASPGFFLKTMEKMMEMNEKASFMKESLIERAKSGGTLTEAEMFEIQVAMGDATTSLGIFQSFDKKSEEGVKLLMTGQ